MINFPDVKIFKKIKSKILRFPRRDYKVNIIFLMTQIFDQVKKTKIIHRRLVF